MLPWVSPWGAGLALEEAAGQLQASQGLSARVVGDCQQCVHVN